MDLLGGYGSGSDAGSDAEDAASEPVLAPSAKLTRNVTAAPEQDALQQRTRQDTAPSVNSQGRLHWDDDDAKDELVPRLVAPAGPLEPDAELEVAVGPAPPPPPQADEKEIPGIAQPEVWSKLPAPKAPTRRVVQLLLPLNKALLTSKDSHSSTIAAGADSDDDGQPRLKRRKAASGTSALLSALPPPVNDLGRAGRTLGGGGGTFLDLGTPTDTRIGPDTRSAATGAVVLTSGTPGASKGTLRAASIARRQLDSDDEEEDPMARLGPMPEAGAYAAGPAADEDDDDVDGGILQGDDGAAGPSAERQPMLQGEAAAYYVGDTSGAAYSGAYGGYEAEAGYAYGYDAGQYGSGGLTAADAAAPQPDDPGEALFAQALAEEQQRAAKRGQALSMDGIQFKEVNARELKYMDPAARAASQGAQAALGVEYASALRADAKPFEGNKMAKRKHQIGTLFFNAKMRELEILEGKAAGLRAKSEAKAKYGW